MSASSRPSMVTDWKHRSGSCWRLGFGGVRRSPCAGLTSTPTAHYVGCVAAWVELSSVSRSGHPRHSGRLGVVPLPQFAVTTLRLHPTRQAAERLTAGLAWTDADLVFSTEVGTPLEPRNVLRRFQVITTRLGLAGVSLHTLRHSVASFLVAAGTHTKVVSDHLGHSSYAITADVYSHVTPVQAREAADRLDAALDW